MCSLVCVRAPRCTRRYYHLCGHRARLASQWVVPAPDRTRAIGTRRVRVFWPPPSVRAFFSGLPTSTPVFLISQSARFPLAFHRFRVPKPVRNTFRGGEDALYNTAIHTYMAVDKDSMKIINLKVNATLLGRVSSKSLANNKFNSLILK
jgi:hypothetical protein